MTNKVKWMYQGMGGAPVLTNNWGSMTALLDACLVNGFNLQTASSITRDGSTATALLTAVATLRPRCLDGPLGESKHRACLHPLGRRSRCFCHCASVHCSRSSAPELRKWAPPSCTTISPLM